MSREVRLWDSYGPLFSFEEREVFTEDAAELEFYDYICGRFPGRRVELGAGDGRLTRTLPTEDLTLALEPSRAILDCWRKDDSIPRLQAIAQALPLADSSMDLVLFPYNGLHCILQRFERKRVLKEAFRVLRSGGVFVAELCPGFSSRPQEDAAQRFSYSRNNVSLRLTESVSHRPQKERIVFSMDYSGTAVESGSVHIELELAYISAAEILTDLREAGMQVISLWGDYDLSPWGGDSSPRLLLAGVRSGS